MAIKYYSGINISGNIVPSADSTFNLGGPAFYFANVYADNLYGDGSNITNIGAAQSALTLTVTVKNKSGGSLAKGTVVHAAPSANPPSGNVIEVIAADYDTVANMPGLGILNETLANDAEGEAVMFGAVSGIDTSSFLVGTELYVGNDGALTGTKPTATDQLIQKIAVVIKSSQNNGIIKVFGAGRTNDVPNKIDRTIQFDANQRFTDNSLILMGGGDMFQIGHKASYSQIATYEGNLYIDNNANDFDIVFRSDDGNGGLATYYYLDGSEGLNRFSKNILLSDDVSLSLGNGFDLKLLHNGTDSYIDNSTGNLTIRNLADDKDVYISSDDGSGGTTQYFRAVGAEGSVYLFHYGNKKFETTSTGAKVSGDLEVTGNFTVSGTTTFIDTTHLNVGDNIITLNADLSGSTAPTEDAGIAIYRGSSPTVSFEWDETNDIWTLGNQGLVADNLNITKENAAPTLNLLKGGNNPSTNELIGRLNFQTDYSGSPQDWARINVETNSSSVRTDMDFYVKSTSGALQTGLRLQGGTSTPKAFFYNDVNVDGGVTVSNILTVENVDGGGVGYVQIGTVDNDLGNNYVRGNILIGRDEDQVTWDSANDEWTYTGGSSSDFSMLLADSEAFRIFVGDTVTSGTTYTNTEFRDAFQALTIGQAGNINVYRGDLQVGNTTVIDSSRIHYANATASNTVPKYTFVGDTDTGLGYIGTNSVGLIAQGSRKFYINNTDAYFQNLSGAVHISSDLNVDGDTFKVDSTNNRVAINGSISSISRAYIFDSDSDPDTSSQGLWVRGVYSGTKSVAADHIKRGIYVDVDSSASGTTTDEHMLFGIQVDARNSGLADAVTGVYSYVESNVTTQSHSYLRGGYFAAASDITNTSGNVSEIRGIESAASIQDVGSFNNAFASYNRLEFTSTRNANNGASYGGYFEVEINNPNANSYGTMFGVRSVIDNNEGTVPSIGTSYLFYGDYQGTRAASNSWGIHVQGDKHYLEGKLGIGTTDLTTHALNVSGSGYVSGGLTSNGALSVTGGNVFRTYNITHTDRRITINQNSGEYPRIYNYDEGDQTFHSIKIGGGNDETSGIVIDGSGNVTIHGTLDVSGTIDLSDANLDIGSADIIFGIDATDTGARGLIWNFDGDGDGNPVNIGYIRAGGTVVGEVMQFNMNSDGSVTGSGTIYQFMNGGTDILTVGREGNLSLRTTTSGAGSTINFSDHASGSYAQQGNITYYHVDTASYGSGNAFAFTSTEASLTVLADGKLMFTEGLYIKPSSGTGGGTRIIDSSGNFYGGGANITSINASNISSGTLSGDRLPWANNDGFTGTYPLVWKASNTPYTASWLNVNGSTDTLHTVNLSTSADVNISGDLSVTGGGITRIGNGGYDLFINGGVMVRDYSNAALTNGRFYFDADAWYFRGGGEGEADTTTNTAMYIRHSNGFGEVWHSRNDGSGSGLDADTVDGYHASSFFIDGDTVLNMANNDGLVYNDTNNLMYIKADGTDYQIIDTRGGTFSGQINASGGINMSNTNLSNVNHITINDAGAGEGIQWNGGNGWQIYESPDAMTNASGNLQFTTGTTFRFRVDTSGNTFSSSSSRAPLFYDSNDTNYYVNPNGVSYMNQIDGPYFRNIQVPQSGLGSSYDERVILLIPKVETNDSYNNRIHGKLTMGKTGGNVIDFFDIEAQSVWNNTTVSFTSKGQRTGHKLVTCTYNSIKWVAIKFEYTANPYNFAWFHGEAITNFSSQAQTDMLKVISYADLSSGTTVLNSEIYNSIADYTPSPLHRKISNGGGDIILETERLQIGKSGMTPQLELMFNDHGSGVGWDTAIHIGKSDDLPEGTGFPAYVPTGSYGTMIKANSDGVFFGMEEYSSGNYRPIIQWGDDNSDSPFRIKHENGSEFEVTYDGHATATSSSRAPIFYDSDNTGYYVDPAGLSYVNEIRSNEAQANPRYDTAFYVLQAQHWYGDTSSQTMYIGESGNSTQVRGKMSIGGSTIDSGYALSMGGPIRMYGHDINHVSQLHFNDNVRFYDDGNDNYLNFKYGDGNNGGIKFLNGSAAQQGYLYAASSGFGLLSADGTWAVQTTNSATTIHHNARSPLFYDSDNTGYYVDPNSTSRLENLTVTHFGIANSSSTSLDGIALYGGYTGGEPTYGLLFTGTALGTHGSVTGSWATYFTMNNDNTRGWIFRRVGSGNCASISGGGTASFNGDVIAYYSDMRLKTKLGDIEDPIGKIQALNGFYYEPNEVAESYGYEKERRVGLSAQEVEAVLPEIVTDAPIGDGYKTVDYAKLVPVLVEAIKEQQKQIDELKKLINP